jgi:hypothetical protein
MCTKTAIYKNEVVTLFSDFINKRKEAFEAQISE